MDVLIELIIRAIAAAFRDKKPVAPPPPLPPIPRPSSQSNPNMPAYANVPQSRRPASMIRKIVPQRRPTPKKQMVRPPAMPGRARVESAALPEIVSHAGESTAGSITTISHPVQQITAEQISSLIRSRPNSLRTMVVLSEVLMPPLALRETDVHQR